MFRIQFYRFSTFFVHKSIVHERSPSIIQVSTALPELFSSCFLFVISKYLGCCRLTSPGPYLLNHAPHALYLTLPHTNRDPRLTESEKSSQPKPELSLPIANFISMYNGSGMYPGARALALAFSTCACSTHVQQ